MSHRAASWAGEVRGLLPAQIPLHVQLGPLPISGVISKVDRASLSRGLCLTPVPPHPARRLPCGVTWTLKGPLHPYPSGPSLSSLSLEVVLVLVCLPLRIGDVTASSLLQASRCISSQGLFLPEPLWNVTSFFPSRPYSWVPVAWRLGTFPENVPNCTTSNLSCNSARL